MQRCKHWDYLHEASNELSALKIVNTAKQLRMRGKVQNNLYLHFIKTEGLFGQRGRTP